MNNSSEHPLMQLPRFTRNEAEARNVIARHGRAIPLPLGETVWLMDIQPVTEAPMLPDEGHALDFEWAGSFCRLELPSAAAAEIAAPLLDGDDLPTMPPELADAVLEAGLAEASRALEALGRGAPQWRAGSSAALPHACVLRLAAKQNAIEAVLRTDSLGLLLLAGLLQQRPPAPPAAGDELVLALPIEIGFVNLAADLLSTLAAGDVLLMERYHVGEQRVLWLSADGAAGLYVQLPLPDADAAAAAPTLTIIHSWIKAMPASDSPSLPDTAASLDTVPIRLSFDLGTVTLTLAEVRALLPGQTLLLPHPLSGVVNIRANGALIGEGDLVEVDGQPGISIRSLSGQTLQRKSQ